MQHLLAIISEWLDNQAGTGQTSLRIFMQQQMLLLGLGPEVPSLKRKAQPRERMRSLFQEMRNAAAKA